MAKFRLPGAVLAAGHSQDGGLPMKKSNAKKLSLKKETVRVLTQEPQATVAGGLSTAIRCGGG